MLIRECVTVPPNIEDAATSGDTRTLTIEVILLRLIVAVPALKMPPPASCDDS